MNLMRNNLLLLAGVLILAIIPMVMLTDVEFGGSDAAAQEVILELNPNYEPWFDFVWEPPGGEVESMLFALQAALGGGFLGYYIGVRKKKKKESEK